MAIFFMGDLTVHHPLIHPEHVDRSENNPCGSQHREESIKLKRPQQDQEFAHKAIEAGQANRREHDHQEKHRKDRHLPPQMAAATTEIVLIALLL